MLDSKGYLQFDWSFPALFTNIRTIGYPAFLRIVELMDPRLVSLAMLQLWIHLFAVFFFALSLASLGVSSGMVLCISTPLLYSPAMRTTYFHLMSDSLACSLGLFVVAMAVLVVRYPSRRLAWGVLAFTLFATYLVRPAYIFLILFIPLLILFLGLVRIGVRRFKPLLTFFITRSVVGCIAPFILFCSLRLVTVGHFGLVSFGGYNMVGIISQFLNPEDMATLPLEFHPLAEKIFLERQKRNLINIDVDGRRFIAPNEIMNNYNLYIHYIIVPYLEEQGMQTPDINRTLVRFSKILLHLHAHDYVHWLLYSLAYALANFPDPIFISVLSLILFVSFLLRSIVGRSRSQTIDVAPSMDVSVIVAIGMGYLMCKVFLVILVELPVARYVLPAFLFLPSVLLAGILANCRAILRQRHVGL